MGFMDKLKNAASSVSEAASGFESDVVGGAQDHLRERLANFELLCFARAESEFCECLDGCHLVA